MVYRLLLFANVTAAIPTQATFNPTDGYACKYSVLMMSIVPAIRFMP